MDQSVDILDLISSLLDAGDYKAALSVPNDEKYLSSFKDNCWDLMSMVIGKVEDNTMIIKPSLQGACEEFLLTIVQKAVPEEALLEFIEQIEIAKNDAQFSIVLTAVQELLKKLTIKRGRSLEWCLNSISTYIEGIPVPEYKLQGKERLLMENDAQFRRIIRVYSLLPTFYAPFVKELSVEDANVRTKQIISAFLVSLLGKPIIFLDLDPELNSKSEARQCISTMILDLCTLVRNIMKFLPYVHICHKEDTSSIRKKTSSDADDELLPYEHKEKINMTTLSGLFYATHSGHFEVPESAVPCVYSPEYTVNTILLCAVHLLGFTEYGPLHKGIILCKAIFVYIPDNCPAAQLSSIHYDLSKALINIAIFSHYEYIRKYAVNLIKSHIHKFEHKGRCILIKYIINVANHSGMIGYVISLYKENINEVFKQNIEMPSCYMGTELIDMIKKICHLPHGAESDLVELADHIITTLNFLRYLLLRDTKNVTGIRDCIDMLEADYLSKLRVALNMSKAHYEVKLKDIEESRTIPEAGVEISVNVGGNYLDKIPTDKKKEIIHSALNAFHLIEGLLACLSESLRIGRRFVKPLPLVPISNAQRTLRFYCQRVNENIRNTEAPMQVVATEHEEHQYEENVKSRILTKALEFVTKHGWSVDSLSQGAEAAGYPGISHGLFPNGGGDLVHYFNVRCNEQLVEQMKAWPKQDLKESKIPAQQIEDAIMTRLQMIGPYKSTWPKAMAIQTLPNNVPNCLATLLSLVDDICYHTGDRSVDFNWYIRRVGLAGIYKASELFYLTDNTQDNSATRSFVKSRIRDAELIQTALNMNPVSVAPQTLTAAFVTAKNMLGVNTLK
ncbi:glomulin-like [Epargyreus clarus]|uniref:glomulin-like n=1 Tax=Epargyreus clarus TaxID=520877 RepID=UPI003C2CB0A5